MISPSVCPLDQVKVIAARTGASSLATPLANEMTRLALERSIHAMRSNSALRRIIMWNSAMISRASISVGTVKMMSPIYVKAYAKRK